MQYLIVKTSSLGDIIHAFNTVDFIKRKFPEASIDWVVERPFAELLLAHPLIRHVICIDTKRWRKKPFSSETRQQYRAFKSELQSNHYDAVFDLQGNIKSGWVTYLAHATTKIGFGSKTVPERPNLWVTNQKFDPPTGQNIRDDYLFLARSYFNDFTTPASEKVILKGSNPVCSLPLHATKVMVCPGSAWPNKQLKEDTLEAFLNRYQSQTNCHYLFIWGNEQEKALAHRLAFKVPNTQVAEKMSIPVLQKLMQQMNLIIAVDSLPLHLAGTTNTPTYSVFGPSSGAKYAPIGSEWLQGSCPYHKTFEKRCPLLRTCSTGACMKDISSTLLNPRV